MRVVDIQTNDVSDELLQFNYMEMCAINSHTLVIYPIQLFAHLYELLLNILIETLI